VEVRIGGAGGGAPPVEYAHVRRVRQAARQAGRRGGAFCGTGKLRSRAMRAQEQAFSRCPARLYGGTVRAYNNGR